MCTVFIADENFAALAKLFPNCCYGKDYRDEPILDTNGNQIIRQAMHPKNKQ
jgi:hypothetical protein